MTEHQNNSEQTSELSTATATTATATATSSSSSSSRSSNSMSKTNKTIDESQTKRATLLALKQFVDDNRHFSLIRNFRLADVITIMNGVCGSLSIFSSSFFLITLDLDHLRRACLFPILSLGFDFLDGKVARFRNEQSVLGQELDSLADLISFGVAPAMVGFSIGLRHLIDVLMLTCFICAGLTRLARFNSTAAYKSIQSDNSLKPASSSFEGLPIPTSLWLIAGMYESIRRSQIELPIDPQLLNCLLDPSLTQESSSTSSHITHNSQSNLNQLRQIRQNGNRLMGGLVENSWGLKVHWISIGFGIWAILMLSKTLKVPKI
ncbi:hypothetical protein BY996DRAFT_6433446 [Phakopsora pachyrhizi]|nr:hypothetical protein BY996DRAFT_6433446 [Phakopsora pachyrhizi]